MSNERRVSLPWPADVANAHDAEALNDLSIAYLNASSIRHLLAQVLTNEVERDRMAVESESFLDKPNLDQRRDWKAGHIAGLRRALSLLTMTEVTNDRRR